eukprot:3465388-Pyramimonas_sp.AAC.1
MEQAREEPPAHLDLHGRGVSRHCPTALGAHRFDAWRQRCGGRTRRKAPGPDPPPVRMHGELRLLCKGALPRQREGPARSVALRASRKLRQSAALRGQPHSQDKRRAASSFAQPSVRAPAIPSDVACEVVCDVSEALNSCSPRRRYLSRV